MIHRPWPFYCAHTRQKFYDVNAATSSPVAHEALQRIGTLYAIEADIQGHTAEQRRQYSRSLVEAMHAWLTDLLDRLSGRSKLAQAIRYALNHWNGLVRFLDEGRFELYTNIVERSMRPVALGPKNALFARGGQRRKALGDGRNADPDGKAQHR